MNINSKLKTIFNMVKLRSIFKSCKFKTIIVSLREVVEKVIVIVIKELITDFVQREVSN
ncbi:MAG: hypothetical protein RBT49_00215 [Bacteroidales bacterium]|jgi:hypothetical protein|nr:hypothetical protein [Bacteroidales bacterium]